jgi:hypothetical protein
MTVEDSLRSLLDYECLFFRCDWLGSDLRIGHLRITKDEWRTKNRLRLNWTLETKVKVKVKVTLRLMVSQ